MCFPFNIYNNFSHNKKKVFLGIIFVSFVDWFLHNWVGAGDNRGGKYTSDFRKIFRKTKNYPRKNIEQNFVNYRMIFVYSCIGMLTFRFFERIISFFCFHSKKKLNFVFFVWSSTESLHKNFRYSYDHAHEWIKRTFPSI
jgi:hypothetical protein